MISVRQLCIIVALTFSGFTMSNAIAIEIVLRSYGIPKERILIPANDEYPVTEYIANPLAALPLRKHKDAMKIVASYWESYFKCGFNTSTHIPPVRDAGWLSKLVTESTFIAVPNSTKILLVQKDGDGAIIDLDNFLVLTPQCPLGVKKIFWGSSGKVLIATQEVSNIQYRNSNPAFWNAKFESDQSLYSFNLSGDGGFRKIASLGKERVLDVSFPLGDTDNFLVLSKSEHTSAAPQNWLRTIAGHPVSKMDITLRKIHFNGNIKSTTILAKDIVDADAYFSDH